LLFPKIMATIASVGGIKTRLQYHKTKEVSMVTDSVKSFRYEKIESVIVDRVHELADEYKKSKITYLTAFTEDELDQEAYTNACNMLMENIAKAFGKGEMYWIYEIILEEYFDYDPSARNPYALRKPRKDFNEEHLSNPYKLIVANFR